MRIRSLFAVVLLSLGASHALDGSSSQWATERVRDEFAQHGRAVPVRKTSEAAMVYYKNEAIGIEYTAPAGWTFDAPFAVATLAVFVVKSPNYLPTVTIAVEKHSSNGQACAWSRNICHGELADVYAKSGSLYPEVAYASDTIYPDTKNGFFWLNVLYGTGSANTLAVSEHGMVLEGSSVRFSVSYLTTNSDFIANNEEYLKHDLNLDLLPTALAKPSTKEGRRQEQTRHQLSILRDRTPGVEGVAIDGRRLLRGPVFTPAAQIEVLNGR